MAQGAPIIRTSWRLALLALGFVSLAFGVAGGLARVSDVNVSLNAVALHGALMVCAFFGTVISLERAAALGRPWACVAPLCAGVGGMHLLAGLPMAGFAWITLGSAVLVAASIAIYLRQRSVETGALAAGAAAWLAGNASVFFGRPAVPWWIAFFVLTIGAERLELSRYLKHGPAARHSFAALAAALVVTPLVPRALGLVLVLLAAWLLRFDLARVTVRQAKLERYVAVCLLAGYFWLAVGGVLMALSIGYDAALHAVFLGFVFSTVFGHAPIILPALLRVAYPYHPVLYAPLVLLHLSVALRMVWTEAGAWGNAAAIALFLLTSVFLVTILDTRQSAGAAPR
jgi:hypothetical protein